MVHLSSRSSSPACSMSGSQRHSADTHAVNHTRSQRRQKQTDVAKSANRSTRNAQAKPSLRYYECEGVGHYARECPTRYKKEVKPPDSPGKRDMSRRSSRLRFPGNKSSPADEREINREATSSGNGKRARKQTALSASTLPTMLSRHPQFPFAWNMAHPLCQ